VKRRLSRNFIENVLIVESSFKVTLNISQNINEIALKSLSQVERGD
jgi:hypothetical protein